MEDKFYYYISSRSSLGVIKKGTGVSKNEEDAIINYMVYGDFDEKIYFSERYNKVISS